MVLIHQMAGIYSHFCRFWYDSISACIFLYNAALFLSILV